MRVVNCTYGCVGSLSLRDGYVALKGLTSYAWLFSEYEAVLFSLGFRQRFVRFFRH